MHRIPAASCSDGTISSPSTMTKKARAKGDEAVAARTCGQSMRSRSARAIAIRLSNRRWCSEIAISLVMSTSSRAMTRIVIDSTASSSPRAITSSSIGRPLGQKMRSTSTSPSQALTSHSSGGSSARMPASIERLQRAVHVLALDHQVEVVARLRAAARPRREAPAEQERDAGLAQRRRGLLQRRLDVGERLLVFHGHMARRTRVRAGAWPSARRTTRAVRPVTAARSGSRRPATSISAARATRNAGRRPSPDCASRSTSCCSPATSRRTASRSRRRWSPRPCGRSTASRSWPCSATTTGTRTGATRWWPRSRRAAASTCSSATTACSSSAAPRSGSPAARASAAASTARTSPTSGSR